MEAASEEVTERKCGPKSQDKITSKLPKCSLQVAWRKVVTDRRAQENGLPSGDSARKRINYCTIHKSVRLRNDVLARS